MSQLKDRPNRVAELSAPPVLFTDINDNAAPEGEQAPRAPLAARTVNLLAVLVPLAGFIAAMVLLWGVGFSWLHLALLASGYILTAIGVTVGYHRYFTHKSFETNPVVKAILGILGSMAVEGPVIRWAATHRLHHQHSDRHDDPHSPHTHGIGLWATIKGMFHAHCGWIISGKQHDLAKYVPDLESDAVVRSINRLFPLWVVLGLLIPAGIAFAITGTWTGALLGFLWGGLARVFLVHHATWSVNSICHLWGTRPFSSHDHSRNNPIVGILGLGEGWHNNHHAFPASARHGLRWWEVDISYMIIRLMVLCRLASNVRVPSPERVAAKRTR
jgi:stearoyl-CoA desaturase (Delta-9 desaturase)